MGNEVFGARLRALRKEHKETQPVLAAALGVSRSAISMYESGLREPDLATLSAIAAHYGVDMNYLMHWNATGEQAETVSSSAKDPLPDVTFDDFTYAMYGAGRTLTEDQKETLLNMARFLQAQNEKEG